MKWKIKVKKKKKINQNLYKQPTELTINQVRVHAYRTIKCEF